MKAEFPLRPGDTVGDVARELLEQAKDPDHVHWFPRPNAEGGGVFELADEGIAERVNAARQARAQEDEVAEETAPDEAEDDDGEGTEGTGDALVEAPEGKPLTTAQRRAAQRAAKAAKVAAPEPAPVGTEGAGDPGVGVAGSVTPAEGETE